MYAKSFVQVFRFLINLYKGSRWAIRTSIFISECLGKRLFASMANDGRLKDNSSFPFVNFQRNIRRPAVFFPECLWYRDLSSLVDSYLIHRNFLPKIKKGAQPKPAHRKTQTPIVAKQISSNIRIFRHTYQPDGICIFSNSYS